MLLLVELEPAVTRALEPAQRGRQTEGKTSKRAPGHSSTLDDRSGSLVVFYQYWRGSFHKDRYAGPSPPYWGQQSPMHPRQISTTTSTTKYPRQSIQEATQVQPSVLVPPKNYAA